MMTRTQIDAPVAGEESPEASATLETKDSIDQAIERFETHIATSLERFTNNFIRDVSIAAVFVFVAIKFL